jgi:glycosyltransferase involved in cell wall biosynthesis
MQAKVSVIIPIYNTEKYLIECVESVRNQSLHELEIILVDDGSPDNAPVLCDEFAKQDRRIKVVHKKNEGLGFARNSGLDEATGEFVSFIDSDDFISHDMMEKLYLTAKKYDADEVRSGTIFYNNGKETLRREVDEDKVFKDAEQVKSFVLDLIGPLPEEPRDVKYMMSVCLSIHKRSMIEKYRVRFSSERMTLSEDLIFNLDLLPKMNCIVCIPNCYYYYRMNPNSLTHSFSMEKYKKTSTFLNEVRERLGVLYQTNEFYYHFLRLCFLYLRNNINACIRTKEESLMVQLMNVKVIINDGLWSDLLTNYPYCRMKLKHRLYFKLLKSKKSLLIMIVSKLVF